jgi:hypothetical protein
MGDALLPYYSYYYMNDYKDDEQLPGGPIYTLSEVELIA